MDTQRQERAEAIEFGHRIRRLREWRGWSQRELAQQMSQRGFDWNQSAVARAETARRPVEVTEIYALARVFERSVESLIFEATSRGALVHAVQAAEESLEAAKSDQEAATLLVALAEKSLTEACERLSEFETEQQDG